MPDLLIRGLEPELKRQIEERARSHGRSLSGEAKFLLRKGLSVPEPVRKLGTEIAGLIPTEDRTEEPEFEVFDPLSNPPDFR